VVGGGQVGAVAPWIFSGLIIIIIIDGFNVLKKLKNAVIILNSALNYFYF